MLKLAVILAAHLLFALPAHAASFEPDQNGAISFNMPSGNVGCIYIPEGGTAVYQPENGQAELQCDRVEPAYTRVLLGDSGKAHKTTNVGDASCCGADNIFQYGESWSEGPFTCTSSTTGLTCRNGGHGFKMSRKRVSVW